ncbi:beta-ketoacyl-[acyl-carrier-protein] synthase II [Microbulbifer sp. A4B17]|uniref:beta-ketoacyl-ACP synthase n=1 Tax=Microbulbifer sp. A4B17 TaxID=359370 RepID=UPI000D52AB16|nr:beta-ketoacyl-ACP synthase [Microbulbifer sp. A4B17]AWF79418.1 beta-ketoacyl-[acyl-carrier-protein] synthase II [Microbulbifer sp. A4B17]
MKNFYLNHMGIICTLGNTAEAVANSLFGDESSHMQIDETYLPQYRGNLGIVQGKLPDLPSSLQDYHCRNNQLALAVLAQIESAVAELIEKHGAGRIGVVMGTSTSGIDSGEAYLSGEKETGYNYRLQQQMAGLSTFVAKYLGIQGVQLTVSTACSSSANAFASARRLISTGTCDAVVVGGVDSLCGMTVRGFHSLGALSAGQTNPFSVNRDGINLGEAGAMFVLSKEPGPVVLSGVAATSDAHHMSAPDPEGRGAEACMRGALENAGLDTADIDYLNLHGTGTPHNDFMEALAVERVFGSQLPCSSTKPYTGHTLGAAGALEAAFCWLALQYDQLPHHQYDGHYDPEIVRLNLYQGHEAPGKLRYVMSNSFAFGGSNCSVILGSQR